VWTVPAGSTDVKIPMTFFTPLTFFAGDLASAGILHQDFPAGVERYMRLHAEVDIFFCRIVAFGTSPILRQNSAKTSTMHVLHCGSQQVLLLIPTRLPFPDDL